MNPLDRYLDVTYIFILHLKLIECVKKRLYQACMSHATGDLRTGHIQDEPARSK
jgi:hypothetical protein